MADEDNENNDKNEKASTSKNDTKRSSRHEIYYYNDRADNDRDSNSDTSVSATNSTREMDTVDAQQELSHPTIVKRERESKVRRKSRRRVGRVEKKRRSLARRHRRAPRRKPRVTNERKARNLSVSSMISGLSSKDKQPTCIYCGHRCCRKRYYEKRRGRKKSCRSKKCVPRRYHRKINYMGRLKNGRAKKNRKNEKRIIKERIQKIAELTQVGSRSPMFSPLFISNSVVPHADNIVEKKRTYAEVTPQIIHDALKKLTAWRQSVATADLLDYIHRKYPVNPERTELYTELKEKLRIASLVGIVVETFEDYWCLKSPLQMRNLSINHVTLFWEAYGDTLSAIKRPKKEILDTESTDGQTNRSYKNNVNICDDII